MDGLLSKINTEVKFLISVIRCYIVPEGDGRKIFKGVTKKKKNENSTIKPLPGGRQRKKTEK